MTSNLQVLQSTVWMKYRPLFLFLQRHAPSVANEVQRAYVGIVRTFFETGFRRYLRSLGWIKVWHFVCPNLVLRLTVLLAIRRLGRWKRWKASQASEIRPNIRIST